MHPRAPIAACALWLPLWLGCVDIDRTRSDTTEHIIDRRRETVEASAVSATAELDGFQLDVRARRRCNLVEMREVETTTTFGKEMDDDDAVVMGVISGLGAVPLGFGIAMLADAPAVYDDDLNSQQYNYQGQATPYVLGSLLTAIGGTMVGVAVVNGMRLIGSEDETSTSTQQGPVLRQNVPCKGGSGPAADRAVTIRFRGGSHTIGRTDHQGRLSVDLAATLPAHIFQRPDPLAILELWLDQEQLGHIDATALARTVLQRHDEQSWQGAQADACAQQVTEAACAGVAQYLQTFPQGQHAMEADALLAALRQPPLVVAGEDATDVEAAKEAAREAVERVRNEATERAREACIAACLQACADDPSCQAVCTEEACP